MEEAFRRAIRKMTGKSLVRLSGRPDRNQVLALLAHGVSASWMVALHEHLEASLIPGEGFQGESEIVSHSPTAWKQCRAEFPALAEEFRGRLADFRAKWVQRFSLDALQSTLLQGHWLQQDEDGWFFNMRGVSQEVRNLYYETVHLMVGDAEKLVVMMTSRSLHIQDRLSMEWHRESLHSPASKLLPSLEAGLRDLESISMRNLRESLSALAFRRFALAFKPIRGKFPHQPTQAGVVRGIGRIWNPVGVWETGFLGYLHDFCDFTDGLVQLIGSWYGDKWSLFLRGYSAGQLELFGSRPDLASSR
ncbi:MAG TPA: hypothetical protein VLM37_09895 [Fibrobacteraceae bacterium]|nr:hypothetical protein [Fibrobacteraceae bacterium]